MLGALEVVVIIVILGGLLLLQTKTRAGSLPLYLTIGILLVMLIVAMRFIRSLIGVAIVLAFICVVLLWRFARSKQIFHR
jgi:hypothetical protein